MAPSSGGPVFNQRLAPKDVGWIDEGMEITCIPNAESPWDPDVLKAIWSFDPGVIPLWIRWKFKKFNGTNMEMKVFGRHGIGRYTGSPKTDLPRFACEMPSMPCQGVRFERPNLVELILMKANPVDDSPGDFIPWNWDLFHFLRARYKERTPKELKQVVHDKLDREKKEREHLRAEWAYQMADVQKYAEKKMEQAGELELKNHLLSAGLRKKEPKISLVIDPTKAGSTPSAGPVTLT
jgi:hypothetical protein